MIFELLDGKKLNKETAPYIVAELNTSHFGDLDVAVSMIQKAKEIGCDCVKFQSWNESSLYSRSYYEENRIAERMFKKLSLGREDFFHLKRAAEKIGISLTSTPYSFEEVNFLIDEIRVPFIKVASMDIVTLPFLKHIAKRNVPTVLSTGMSTLDEIRAAVSIFEKYNTQPICILHCVSTYPTSPENLNLYNIKMLQEEFLNHFVGYSDHSLSEFASVAAVGLGAIMIEKHFTLDASRIGFDNQMAAEPEVMQRVVDYCKSTKIALGSYERNLGVGEIEQRPKMRRSIIAARAIEAGKIIELADLSFKRPGTGLCPSTVNEVVGRKILKQKFADELLEADDFE